MAEPLKPIESLRHQLEVFTEFRRTHLPPADLRFICVEDLLMQHGSTFRRASRRPPIQPIRRACFAQSYRLATRKRSRWVYCEGFAISPHSLGMAVNHAWVIRADAPNEAYDLAWPEGSSEDTAYIGIPFQPEFVRETHHTSGKEMYSVLDTWWLNYPLITGATRIEDVIWKGEK